MKILIAADLHWPTINGVATFSRSLARGLSERGHEVVVIAPSQTGRGYEEYDQNYVIKRVMSVPFPFYQNFRISVAPQREVKKIIEDFAPDVIHIQMLLGIGQATMRYGKKFNIPVVSTNHAIPENLLDNLKMVAPLARPINYIINEYGRRFYVKSDYVTTPTQSAIDMFVDIASQLPTPPEAVSNGIDLQRFFPGKPSAEVMKKFNLPSDRPVVTYLGRLDAEKHISVLLKAFAQIQKKHDAQLLVVGSGTDAENLKLLSRELAIKRHVTFTGRVTDDEIVQLHRVGDVFCMPSPAELQCIAALEAMASGKPVVAVDAGALGELCQDGINGYLCQKDDVDGIAESLDKILSDKKLQKEFGKKSLEIAHTHDIKYTLDKFEEIYAKVIATKTRLLPQRLL